ncbi:MAG TPA: penicillin acylase family protein [Myxococcota bacterium]|nr:penicillin acylase family protein [Myxococcota bacterium]
MRGSVEILRDELGIAHVRAESLAGAFFGQGYACAQDRLWQMEYDRRRASGRWAEIAGPIAVGRDAFLRRLGLARSAQRDLAELRADTREMLEAYAAGVNAYLASGAPLPVEHALTGRTPEPWQAWHSLAIYKLRHAFMGPLYRKLWRGAVLRERGPELLAAIYAGSGETLSVPPGADHREAARLEAELAAGSEAVAALEPGDGASNHWALAGSRTASGKPLVAGDPHRPLELPNVYWQNHVRCVGFDAIGLSFAGVPGFPHFGHNAKVAWCITHGMADDQDLFVERLRARELASTERRTETVAVRGAAPATVEILTTPRGPVVLGGTHVGLGIALRWTTLVEADPTFDCFLPMLGAANAAELEEAMRAWVTPCNNLIAADVAGSIRYRFRGRVPVRAAANRWGPVPGASSAHAWRGYVPFEALPAVADPPHGMLAAANNRPAGAATPYLGVDFSGPSRVRRIFARLESLEGATVADMAAIHADDLSLVAPLFVRALDGFEPASERAREALALLRAWDSRLAAESVGAALYLAFREQLTLVAGEALGLSGPTLGVLGEAAPAPERLTMVWNAIPPLLSARFVPRDARAAFEWKALAAEAFERALAFLEARLGPKLAEWRYGRVHRTFVWHPPAIDLEPARRLRVPPSLPMGGDGDTVLCGATVPGFSLRATTVSVARYAFDLADWERSGWVVPHGVSGDSASPHHTDQLLAWAELRLLPMRYDWRGIEAVVTSRVTLAPPER